MTPVFGPFTTSPARSGAFVFFGFFLAVLAGVAPATARKKADDSSEPPKEEKKEEGSPYKDWDKTLKDAETMKGLFTIHRKHDDTWLEFAPEQLDRPFLMVSSLTSGLGKGYILGGMPLDTELWVFHRAGSKLLLQIKNSRFRGGQGSPVEKAVALSYNDSVLAAAKIVSLQKGTNHILIDLNEIFVGDLPGLGVVLKQLLGAPAPFDKDRTAVSGVKLFPKNLEIEVAATYGWSEPKGLETVTDPRFLPLGVHYSISELPDDGFRGRLADDRVGYFLTAVKDFSRDASDTFFVRYVNRWKLEKTDPAAAVSPPREPIVFYLDRTIPEEYRGHVREGALMWNKAFEKAGFKDALVVKDPPEDKDFDPEDVRYNTIRWITSSEPAFGAIGPSRVDPRNGHILDADILVEAAMLQNVRRGYRNYVRTFAAASPAPLPGWRSAVDGGTGVLCNLAAGVELDAAVDAAAFQAAGEIEPGGTVPEEYMGQFLRWVVAHEVGHTLGLRHNFRASTATANDRLNDVAWTREHGLYDSVMEYPVANFSLDRKVQGDYYSQSVGDYDLWAIQYGYTPIDARETEDELPALRRIAEQSTLPGHQYGTDEDAFAGPVPIGVDPDTNQFDLGSDPLRFARDRLALIRTVRGKILEKLIAPGESYERLRNTFDSLAAAQGSALQIVSKQIGGLSTSRTHRGDPGARAPFVPVSTARQREAMAILKESGFSDAAWSVPADLLNALQPTRWAHWGTEIYDIRRLDYPFSERVLGIQTELLDRLLHPILLARLLETESRSGTEAYGLAEHMRSLTDAVFSELAARPAAGRGGFAIPVMRRNLGRATLDRLISILISPAEGTPEDARSLARANLSSLEKKMASVLAGRAVGMDETTRAYLEESRIRIRRALEAGTVLVAGHSKKQD